MDRNALTKKHRKKIIFATFFPGCENIHLTKDVGMIPYVLHRDFGYDSHLICYKNGNYPYLETEVSGLKLLFIKKRKCFHLEIVKYINRKKTKFAKLLRSFCNIIDAFPVIIRYGKKIDIFQVYHLGSESIIIGSIYKIINRKGVLWLKLDMDNRIIESYEEYPKKSKILIKKLRHYLFHKLLSFYFDIISVESKKIYEFIRTKHPLFKKIKEKIYCIPNGVDMDNLAHLNINFTEKENTILHVGRIGTYQKATEIILEAFIKIARDFPSWKLILIGTMEDSFSDYFNNLLKKNEDIQNKIQYLGFVKSKKSLYEYYKKAKILAIPSRFESFGLVATEAGLFGDVILGSDIPSIRDITNDGKFAYLCPIDDNERFIKTLRYMLSHEDELKEMSELSARFIKKEFSWNKICSDLHKIILNKSINNY